MGGRNGCFGVNRGDHGMATQERERERERERARSLVDQGSQRARQSTCPTRYTGI